MKSLFGEVGSLPSEERDSLEASALLVVLCTVGVANYVDDWMSLLERIKRMVKADSLLRRITSDFQKNSGLSLFGGLFSIGILTLDSVPRLEFIINALTDLDESDREIWLTPVDEYHADFHDIISGPWAQEWRRDRELFDATDAAIRYARMAVTTQSWRTRSVSLQCSVAQAVMLDEYQNDKEGALRILRETISRVGDDPILGRAVANVYFRHGDHRSALSVYRAMADQISSNPVERVFSLRKAAISAAKCAEWSRAQEWFLEAQAAAVGIEGQDMAPMTVGLRADAAVAIFEAGNKEQALRWLVDAVQALSDIDPDESLRAAYCHHVIRHSALWILSSVGGGDGSIDGTAISLEAGSCSNPEPPTEIRERSLGHIDIVWYMLAKAEVILGVEVGITEGLEDLLEEGRISVMEIDLRMHLIRRAIANLDASEFVTHFKKYIEGQLHWEERDAQQVTQFNPLNPHRAEIPVADDVALSQSLGDQVARDAILAFGIGSAIDGQGKAMMVLVDTLDGHFPNGCPGRTVLDEWNGEQTTLSEFDKATIAITKALLRSEHIVPDLYWTSGVCFSVWTSDSRFKELLTSRIAAWQRREWQRIVANESFRLSRPQQTVPPIRDVLMASINSRRFVAKLLLVVSDAVDTSRAPGFREMLDPMAAEE